jgi:hypothetical protein
VSIDLRHPDLRHRDIKRILAQKKHVGLCWDVGTTAGSEWVYASLEDAPHRQQLLEWLRSKSISESADALILGDGYADCTSMTWGDVMRDLERFFAGHKIMVVSKDLDWMLDYGEQSVARFGRWPQAK